MLHTMDRDALEEHLLQCTISGYSITETLTRFPEPYIKRNGFRLPWEKLNFERFRIKENPVDDECPWTLPSYLDQGNDWCNVEAKLCRDNDRPFLDPEQTELELKDPKMYNQISTSIKGEEDLEKQKQELARAECLTAARRGVLANILGQIHVWRRPYLVMEKPRLFAAGNSLLAHEPKGNTKESPGETKPKKSPLKEDKIATLVKFKDNGIFYDTHLLVAIAMAATRRSVFSNLFVSAENTDVGMFTFQFYSTLVDELHTPEWKLFTVDNMVPLDQNLQPVLGQLDDPNECWLLYMEKAYAKFLESYSLLHHGDVASSITHLTGGFTLLEEWNPETISDEWKAHVLWIMRENCRHGLLTAAVRIEDKPNPPSGEESRHTIRSDADYMEWNDSSVVVLATAELPMKTADKAVKKIIKMRNIYGKNDWFGDWSNDSRTWNKEHRSTAGYPLEAQDDFIQWMAIDDFAAKYNTLLTCQGFASAPTLFYRYLPKRREGACPFYAHQFLVTVIDPADPKFQNSLNKGSKKKRSNLMFVENMRKFEDSDDEAVPDDSDDEDDWSKEERMKKVEAKDKSMEDGQRDANQDAMLDDMGLKRPDADSESNVSESQFSKFSDGTSNSMTREERIAERQKFSFSGMKNSISKGVDDTNEAEEKDASSGPQFMCKIQVSQPPHQTHGGTNDQKATDVHACNVHVFQMRGPLMQPCSFVENSSLSGKTDQQEGDIVHYRFPTNNRVNVKEDRPDDLYTVQRSCALQPGHYVVAVYQKEYWDDLHYCLRIDTEDDPAFPTHFITKIEELGSCGNPIKKPEPPAKRNSLDDQAITA